MPVARCLSIACLLLAMWPASAAPVRAASQTFLVDSLLDEHDHNASDGLCLSTPSGKCTLRAAVMQANASLGADTILLGPGTYDLNRVGDDDNAVNGDLDIDSDLTIVGAGSSQTFIRMEGAAANANAITVLSGVVRFEGVAVHGGRIAAPAGGGGILNAATLTLVGSAVFDNFADRTVGGGISNFGTLTLIDSAVLGNASNQNGGGIYNIGDLTLARSLVAGNSAVSATASLYGGGILNLGQLTMFDSQVHNNVARYGAGVYNEGHLTADLSQFSSSSTDTSQRHSGGGIYNTNGLTVTRSTFIGNAVTQRGAGLFNGGIARLDANTFANNIAEQNHGGAIYNVADASILMHNSTLSGNRSGRTGSAIWNAGSINAYNVTIAFNVVRPYIPEGQEAGVTNAGGTLNLRNSIVAGNYRESGQDQIVDDCDGTLGVFGREYFTPFTYAPDSPPCTFTGPGVVTWTVASGLLAPLALNGGTTLSHWLLPGHPAIDGGDPVHGCADAFALPLTLDQRGFARPMGSFCDSGALENYLLLWLPSIRR